MGSKVGEGDGESIHSVTMDDLNNLETRLSSTLGNEIKQLHKLLEQLVKDKDGSSSPSPQEDPPSVVPKGKAPVSPEGMAVGGKQDNTNSSTQNDDGKGENHDSWYSPDPPIPHP